LKTTGRAAGEGTHGQLWHLGCMGCYSTSEAKRELGEKTTFATYTWILRSKIRTMMYNGYIMMLVGGFNYSSCENWHDDPN